MIDLAGVELGGTKTIAVRGQPGAIRDRVELPTETPETTLTAVADILAQWHKEAALAAVGIASFGPVRVDPAARDYGMILTTPKPYWSATPVMAAIRGRLGVPVAIDTDVNAAALAEHAIGAAKECTSVVYITIGTGVGGGVVINGKPVHGMLHPEIGHLRLRRAYGDTFAGNCSFHRDCVEGLISGPALAARLARHPADVPAADPAWLPVISDFAELLAAMLLAYAPQRIVIGGGVTLKQPHLIAAAIAVVPNLLRDYLGDIDVTTLQRTVVTAALGNDAGPTGALLIARGAAHPVRQVDAREV